MSIEIIEVTSRRLLKHFIHLPAKIHAGHKNWLPPIYSDEWQYFDKSKNRLFSHCDSILLLAKKDGKFMGRIMGLINHKYNISHNELHCRFSFMETYNDPDVAAKLIQYIENWGAIKGMTYLVGPLAFSDKDPQGMMIEGFNEPLVIATNCNMPYQVDLIENLGFTKRVDLVVYKLMIPNPLPDFYKQINDRSLERNINIINFNSRKALKPYIVPILELLNQTFTEIYAFAQLDRIEMLEFAHRYLPVLDPRFIKAIENNKKELVAFVIAMPDMSQGLRKSKGYLFPFGIFQILWSQRKTKQLNLLLGGVRPDYRNSGLDVVMGAKIMEEAHHANLEYIDSHLVLENNLKMRGELQKLGGVVYKKYRIFQKHLSKIG